MPEVLLEARGVGKSFGGVAALTDVSFDIREGELRAVIGPNGAGKTTLFNMVCRVFPLSAGDIMLGDKSITHAAPHRIAALGIARTFQNLQLFGTMTVLENVMVGCHLRGRAGMFASSMRLPAALREEARLREDALALLATVGLSERTGDLAASLPVGQQRLLEIARALGSRPRLLLLDEPAAGLNTRETAALSQLVMRVRDEFQTAVLLIEHDMNMVMGISERVLVLDRGATVVDGPPAQVQHDPRVIEAYLGAETDDGDPGEDR